MDLEQKATEIRVLGNGKSPIDLSLISHKLKLKVEKSRTISSLISPDGNPQIILNSRKHIFQQRVEWAHEIGHFVLHVGNQLLMPKSWTDKQEFEANRFSLYLLVTSEEIEELIRPGIYRSHFTYEISRTLEVPLSFAAERLKLFENKVYNIW